MITHCRLTAIVAIALCLAAVGCDHRAYLDADSLSNSPGQYAGEDQYVHVGEKVNLQFICRPAIDTYAVFDLPGKLVILPANTEFANYRTAISFGHVSSREGVVLRATGFKARGMQDRMMVAGEVEQPLSPNDMPDQEIASDELRLIVYQSHVKMEGLGGPTVTPDWDKSVLRIVRDAEADRPGKVSEVRLAPAGDPSGFQVSDADGDGRWTLLYDPTAEQVNRGGTTTAELHLVDQTGQTHVVREQFATP